MTAAREAPLRRWLSFRPYGTERAHMPETASAHEDHTPYSAGIVSVLPFLYIAWADGLLTPTQIEEINTRVAAQSWLSPDERERLRGWLDPEHPPDATTYYRWVRQIKASAHDMPSAAQKSLALYNGTVQFGEHLAISLELT